MSFEDLPAPVQQSAWTDQLSFSEGVFDISSIPIRYYLTSVPLALSTRTFRLVEDIPGSEDWGYDAIFQRDIDEDRVKEELLNDYLLVRDKFSSSTPSRSLYCRTRRRSDASSTVIAATPRWSKMVA